MARKRNKASDVDFAQEYAYVISDLKRFALTSIAMFALLVILALTVQ